MYPAIFLDRDGVIIENRANYVRSWDDVVVFSQALEALANIRSTIYKIIIVTNQSAVGRGIITLNEADAINKQLVDLIHDSGGRVDGVYMCPHAPQSGCNCRKPQPGMLQAAARGHNLDLRQSIMIGDALTDLQAGWNAGIGDVALVKTGRGEHQAQQARPAELPVFLQYADLTEALASWLARRNSN